MQRGAGFTPPAAETVTPASAVEAAEVIAQAASLGRPVVVRGSGSRRHWQPELPPDALLLNTLSLGGEVELHAENLTAAVPAGLPLAQVRRRLEEEGFWLPLAHLDGPAATLGGCLAAGFVNPLRLGFGLPRDWVLGLEVVSGTGETVRLGGELVKNVAGYDLVKMHLGNWGRIGLLTRATLRLLPLPEAQVTVEARLLSAAAADAAVHNVLHHPARPCAVEIAGRPGDWVLLARLVGDQTRIVERATALAHGLGNGQVRQGEEDAKVWSAYSLHRQALERTAGGGRFKVGMGLPALVRLEDLMNERFGLEGWSACGHAASGVYTLFLAGALHAGAVTIPAGVAEVRRELRTGEHLVLEGVLAAAGTGCPGWHSFPPRGPRSQDGLEAAVMRALAPGPRLNPHLPHPPAAGGAGGSA